MRGSLRDPILYAHAAAVVGAAFWLGVTAPGPHPAPLIAGIVAIAILVAATVTVAFVRARDPQPGLERYPSWLYYLDLGAAGLWMIASAPNPRSVAFVVLLVVGSIGTLRFGRAAFFMTIAAYVPGRIGQEWYRVATGTPTPAVAIVGEVSVLVFVGVVLTALLSAWQTEGGRAAGALRRASSLERVARDLAAETDPGAVLRSIPQHALAVVDADYACIVLRSGGEFEIAAGAGLAERVVGMRRRADEGVFGDVLARRATVALDDYATHPRAVASARDLGLRAIAGVPIFVSGEMAACLIVARITRRPFDPSEIEAVEGLAAHAVIALRNARRLDQARRLEQLARAAIEGWQPAEVFERVVQDIEASFGVDVVAVATVSDKDAHVVAAAGAAKSLIGSRGAFGPLLKRAVRSGELVAVGDYAIERAAETEGAAAMFFDRARVRAAMLAPIRVYGRVAAVLTIGTTDAHRTFDQLDRQAVAAFADATRAALRAVESRRESERHIERLSILNELAARLTLVHESKEIARLAWDAAGRLAPRDAFYVAKYDEERQMFEFLFQEDLGVFVSEETVMPLGDGPSSRAVRTGEAYVVNRKEDPVQRSGRPFGDDARRSAAAVHVPLRIGRRVVGVLSTQSYTPNAYDEEHVAILRSLGSLVAAALENAHHIARTRELYLASVKALAAAVDARDPYTRSHSARVAALARTIAEEMGLPVDEIRRVQLGALLHDIGKIGIPDAILNKPGPLTDEEWVIMRTHSALGGSIVQAVEPLAELGPVIRWHHERYDGTGYPDRLRGDDVPLGSYIVAAADAFEVIVSRRAYKQAQTVDHAILELQRCRGAQFHPAVVDAFVRIIERDRTEGTAYLTRVKAIEHEDIEDVPGPGDVLERLAASTQTHARQLAILQRIASEISAVLDTDAADRLLRIVCEAMGYENGFLLTLDETGSRITVRAAVGPSAGYVGQVLERGQGISWWVIDHGRLQNVADVHSDTRFVGPPEVRSSLIVPLRIGDERVGVIGIESTRPGAFSADDEALLTAVSHQVAAAVRVARLHEEAQRAAATDELTSLPNRRTFFQRLEALHAHSRDGSDPLTVAVVDVDLLKQVNDQFGHGAGDEALVRVGKLLSAGVRGQDLVARLGGDEFGVLFAGAPILLAERIMRRLAESILRTPLSYGGTLPSISWGLAEAATSPTVDALIENADRAMYRHKRRSRERASISAN